MMSDCLCRRLPCWPCVPGGWWRSREKSTHGGPVVVKMMMSGFSWTSGWISKLSVSRSR